MEFDNIEYLKHGNKKQRQVYRLLTKHGIMSSLSVFEPVLVGTIPINVDTDCSDIDIICYTCDLKQFSETLRELFQGKDGFRMSEYEEQGIHAVVGSFRMESFEIEVFGQDIPTRHQLAYRHMLIEHRLLKQKGEGFRQKIIELKRNGFKTEPAFAHLLDLKGDPYAELLNFATDTDNESPNP